MSLEKVGFAGTVDAASGLAAGNVTAPIATAATITPPSFHVFIELLTRVAVLDGTLKRLS
jgi:hypothetical protein